MNENITDESGDATVVSVEENNDGISSSGDKRNGNKYSTSNHSSSQKQQESDKDETFFNKYLKITKAKKYQPQQSNKLYLKHVGRGEVNNVIQLLSSYNNGKLEMNPHYENKHGENALRIAIENRHYEMCKVLLENGVRVDIGSIFYAVEHNHFKFAKLILEYDNCLNEAVSRFSEERQGLFEVIDEEYDKHQLSWEAFVLKQIVYKAMCSPEYITAVCEKEEKDPFDFCMKLIETIHQDSYFDVDQKDFYSSLLDQLEDYMCALLNQIQTTTELNSLFDWFSSKSIEEINSHRAESKIYKQLQAQQLSLLEKACEQKLVKFVTHQNSQFILSKLLKQNTPILRGKSPLAASIISRCFGLLFFLWPLLNLLPPWTVPGGIFRSPNIVFECHLVSEITFLSILIAYVETKSRESDYLGAPPTCFEWFIFVWIVGKLVGEIHECRNRGLRNYLKDYWNHFDIIELSLYIAAILARAIDFFMHTHDTTKVYREQWVSTDSRLTSVGLLAIAYIFTFLGVLCLTRANRLLGPLRVTLTKMLLNVLQFFVIFALLMLAFTVSLTELYWYQRTEQGTLAFCERKNNDTASLCPTPNDSMENTCKTTYFTGMESSLQDLFWALFGQLEIDCIREDRKGDTYIDDIGVFLVGIYHISIIFILLNMLIAMMTKSFDKTSENKDAEWKFYRTELWIRFIRQDYSGPPPMNLLPDLYNIFFKFQTAILPKCLSNSASVREMESFDNAVTELYMKHKQSRSEVYRKLIQRYKPKQIIEPTEAENYLSKSSP